MKKKKRKIMESNAITKESEFQSAKNSLQALEYERVDEAFLAKHQRELETINDYYEGIGGIFVFTIDEYDVICRIPSREIFEHSTERKDLTPFERDRILLGKCLIYPSMNTVNEWVEKNGHWGIVTSIGIKMVTEAKATQEVKSKKLFLKPKKS